MKAPIALIVVAMTAALAACGEKSEQPATNDTSESTTGPAPATNGTPAIETAESAPPAFAQCKACHSVEPGQNMVGPSLAGVYNRKAGTEAGFAYSEPLKKSGITWNDTALDTWLTNPAKDVPGTRMTFAGYADPAQRKQVIAYLKTL